MSRRLIHKSLKRRKSKNAAKDESKLPNSITRHNNKQLQICSYVRTENNGNQTVNVSFFSNGGSRCHKQHYCLHIYRGKRESAPNWNSHICPYLISNYTNQHNMHNLLTQLIKSLPLRNNSNMIKMIEIIAYIFLALWLSVLNSYTDFYHNEQRAALQTF